MLVKLVKCYADYADEFDVECFTIMSFEQWESFLEALDVISYPFEVGFGTNESLSFQSKEDVLSAIKAKDIHHHEADIIKRHFGKSFGTGDGVFSQIVERAQEVEQEA